jgi:exodeoxyribonuclease-1
MRRVCYRTFYDPYQWHWKDDRSRWDLLDALRMMRALRPDGIKWPFLKDKPTVKLELMAKENGLTHENAHDALSDVIALIELAQKFNVAQPKLFKYLLSMRDKNKVAELALGEIPFIYTSGKYSNEFEKTTVVSTLFKHPRRDSAIVYNLREDPTKWMKLSVKDLVKHWQVKYGDDIERLPIKTMQFNRCPAVAPLSVLDEASKKRLKIEMKVIEKNYSLIKNNSDFSGNLLKALDVIEKEQQSKLPLDDSVDYQLYDGFWGSKDQSELEKVRSENPENISHMTSTIKNKRISDMIPLYKARNYPKLLSAEERKAWDERRLEVFSKGGAQSKMARFIKRMQEIPKERTLSANDEYLLTELQLYVESIAPIIETADDK